LKFQEVKTALSKIYGIINNIVDHIPEGRRLILRSRTFKTKAKGHVYNYTYIELFEGYGHNTRFLRRWRKENFPKEVEIAIELERLFCELKGCLLKLRYLIERLNDFDNAAFQNLKLLRREGSEK